MILGIVGHHAGGKSTISRYLVNTFGWGYISKKALMDDDLNYEKFSPGDLMDLILKKIEIEIKSQPILILDAIHNPEEWKAVKKAYPDSLLIGVFTPQDIRIERHDPGDAELDKIRERYWHNSTDSTACLLCYVEWSFCGVLSYELLVKEAQELLSYLEHRQNK